MLLYHVTAVKHYNQSGLDTLVPLPASCSLPVLQCVLPLEQSIGSQHHSSVISMETSSSCGNDWTPSQSLPFCDRTMEAVLPTPSSQRHSSSYTHIFLFILFLHLYGAVTKMGLSSSVESYCIWMKCFLTEQHQRGQIHSWRVNMPPISQPHWENRNANGDLLVRALSCVFLHGTSVCYFSWAYMHCFSIM